MPKIVLPPIASTTDISLINSNIQKIATELNEKVLYRKNPTGQTNTVETDIDANNNRIINLPKPVLAHEAARYGDIKAAVEAVDNVTGLVVDAQDAAASALNSKTTSQQSAAIAETNANIATQKALEATNTLADAAKKSDLAAPDGSALLGWKQTGTDAVARNIRDKMRESVSVFDFMTEAQIADAKSATPVLDHTVMIQKALDSGARRVFFPDNTIFNIKAAAVNADFSLGDGGIRPKSNQELILGASTLKAIPSDGWASRLITVYLVDNVKITGGKIIGDRDTHDYSKPVTSPDRTAYEYGWLIAIQGSTNITVEGVDIRNSMSDCIHVNARYLATDPRWVQSKNVKILNCTLDGSRRNNISITSCSGFTIRGNKITRAGYNDGVRDGVIPRFGIDLEGYGEGAIDYEIVENGIVDGNDLVDNVNASLSCFTAYKVSISNNTSDHTISTGFGTEISIVSNVIKERSGATLATGIAALGVSATYPYSRNLVSGNTVIGFTTGIELRGSIGTASNNLVVNARSFGISAYQCTEWLITGNNIHAAPTGLDLFDSSDNDVTGNRFRNATSTAIRTRGTSTRNFAAFNRINGGAVGFTHQAGILRTKENFFSGLTSYGEWVRTTAQLFSESDAFDVPTTYAFSQDAGTTLRIRGARIAGATGGTLIYSVNPTVLDVIGCDLEFDRSVAPYVAVSVTGSTNARILRNLVHNRNRTPTLTSTINTSAGTGSLIVGNILLKGTISSNAADTVSDNTLTTA